MNVLLLCVVVSFGVSVVVTPIIWVLSFLYFFNKGKGTATKPYIWVVRLSFLLIVLGLLFVAYKLIVLGL